MASDPQLIERIARAISRKTASAAPAAVLDEIETTHVLVERPSTTGIVRPETIDTPRFRVDLAYQERADLAHIIFGDHDVIGMRACTFDREQREQLVAWLLSIDLEQIRHDAAGSDTAETP